MRSASVVLFAAASAAFASLSLRAGETLLSIVGFGLLVGWMLILTRPRSSSRMRNAATVAFAVAVFVSDESALTSVALLCAALSGWHLATVASSLGKIRTASRWPLLVRQAAALGVVSASALAFVALASQQSMILPFWLGVGLSSGALLLTAAWLATARRARSAAETPSEEHRRRQEDHAA